MACTGRRVVSRIMPPTKSTPVIGEKGFMKLQYIGNEPEMWFGEETNTAYPFDRTDVLFVDIRDAVYLLGPDFEVIN